MFISKLSYFTPAGSPFQEPFFDEKRFIYLFNGSGIFT